MDISIKIIIFIVILVISFLILFVNNPMLENFDAVGLVYNVPPNWFIKPEYDIRNWVVQTYNDAIQPSCLPYSNENRYGSLDNINYLSSAVRFWRF